jgi:hypothetical protein
MRRGDRRSPIGERAGCQVLPQLYRRRVGNREPRYHSVNFKNPSSGV